MLRSIIDVLWGTEPIAAFQQLFGPTWGWLFHTLTLFGSHEAVAVVVGLALWLTGRRLAYAVVVVVVLMLARRHAVVAAPLFDAAVFALAALWLALGAPALFARLGPLRSARIAG